jgi:hypothetical protein
MIWKASGEGQYHGGSKARTRRNSDCVLSHGGVAFALILNPRFESVSPHMGLLLPPVRQHQ